MSPIGQKKNCHILKGSQLQNYVILLYFPTSNNSKKNDYSLIRVKRGKKSTLQNCLHWTVQWFM